SCYRCFPHIVNLACKAVLGAITNLNFASQDAPDFIPSAPPGLESRSFMDAIDRDPIATVQTVVRVIRASSLHRQYFTSILNALKQKDLQLLRDIDVRWSSTLLMVERAILLREGIDRFLSSDSFPEFQKYKLGSSEWDALDVFRKVLSVPHAFQQRLSAEKTLTLCNAIPAFEAMVRIWSKQLDDDPDLAIVIQPGLNKLNDYRSRIADVPAYALAMSQCSYSLVFMGFLTMVNPAIKLNWFSSHAPEKIQWAKDLLLSEVIVLYL
ncbi:hypothetical protein DEU56DRAFT_749813, partial [Suillus clintonianus]|uniref:uncharacterized protein n=1 Tax=Suillus clintonianus TaxID=1904413 RepID=UPI001B8657BC